MYVTGVLHAAWAPSGPRGTHHWGWVITGYAPQLNIRGFGAQWLGLSRGGSNGATSVLQPGGRAGWWSRWLVLVVVWWPV